MIRRAIVAGLLCLDITPAIAGDCLPDPGQVSIVGPVTLGTGGAVGNTGLSLLRLGVPTLLRGKIGADAWGQAVRDVCERHTPGSSSGLLVSPSESTGYTIILSPRGKDRAFLHYPGANNSFSASDVTPDILAQADLFHFGYPSVVPRMFAIRGRELVEVFRSATGAGLTTSLDTCMIDPSSPAWQADWDAILRAVLPYVDLFMPSLDELRQMWDGPNLPAAPDLGATLRRLSTKALSYGAKVVMIKAGTSGIFMRSAHHVLCGRAAPHNAPAWTNRELWAPALAAERVVTATGAGDAAVAGFLAALLRGEPPEQALLMAAAAGACCCEEADTTSGVRTWDETLARLKAGWQRLPLSPGAGWTWDVKELVWRGLHDR